MSKVECITSTKHSKEFATRQVKRLSRRFTATTWDDVSGEEYTRVISHLLVKFGSERTERAVTRTIDEVEFLTPHELRSRIHPDDVERKFCPMCRDSEGWICVVIEGEADPRVYRCKHNHEPGDFVSAHVGDGADRRTVRARVLGA